MVTNNGAGSGMPANAATMMGLLQLTELLVLVEEDKCVICQKDHEKLEETKTTKDEAQKLSNKYHLKVTEELKKKEGR